MMSVAERLMREGMEKGRKEGIEEGLRQTAKKLLLINMDESQIQEITELSAEEIVKIKEDLK